MKFIKMSQFFSSCFNHWFFQTAFFALFFVMMTSIASADELVAAPRAATAADNGYDPAINDAYVAMEKAPVANELCTPASRSTIESRIQQKLKSLGIKSGSSYGLYSFKYDLGLNEEQIQNLTADLGSSFGFQMTADDYKHPYSSETLIALVQKRSASVCQTASK